jgi:hypothetical protein
MFSLTLAQELELISEELDLLRFSGMDQNPKGIRDRLYACVSEAKKQEKGNAQQSKGAR